MYPLWTAVLASPNMYFKSLQNLQTNNNMSISKHEKILHFQPATHFLIQDLLGQETELEGHTKEVKVGPAMNMLEDLPTVFFWGETKLAVIWI